MKNFRILAMLCFTFLIVSCQEESLVTNEPQEVQQATSIEKENISSGRYGKYCFPIIEPGRWVIDPWTNTIDCKQYLPGICSIKWHCFVPPILVHPCDLIPCWIDPIDPWVIFPKLRPEDFLSFRDKLGVDIDPREAVAPFRINEANIGLQFYAPIDDVLNEEVFVLETDLDLGEEFAETFEVKSSVIPAGKYPVVFNKENGTYNALLLLDLQGKTRK